MIRLRHRLGILVFAATLPACGGYEDASTEAEADTVEIPANEGLNGVTAMPVADSEADTDITPEEDALQDGAEEGDDATVTPDGSAETPAPNEDADESE